MANFFYTIILLGAVQGFIVCSLLFVTKKNRKANRILAVLILLISLACFNLYGSYQSWFNSDILNFLVSLIPLVIVMPLGPLVYFYMRSSLEQDFTITKQRRLHFVPAIIDLVPSLTVIVFLIGVLTHSVKNIQGPWAVFIDTYNVYADIPRWMSVSFYVWLSAKYLKNYHQKSNGILNGHTAHFKWLRQFINMFMVFQVIWFIYLVPYVIPKYTDWVLDTFNWYPIYIPLAFLIYWLGIKGYLVSYQHSIADKKATANNLSPEMIDQAIKSLTKAMEADKIFLNPNLNLATMSASTGLAQKTISAVLNQHLQKSFNEFVNGYRVNAFKEKMLLPEMNNLTIAGVALECGFNSQATFQRTFKEFTGKSPSEYRRAVLDND